MTESGPAAGTPLEIAALGRLSIRLHGETVESLIPAKAAAIVVYLGESAGRADRVKLAHLLWSDQPDDQARANLRVALTRLRKSLDGAVGADRNEVWIEGEWTLDTTGDPDVDALVDAHPAYPELLEGWEESGATLFDEWLAGRRSALRAQRVDALKVRIRFDLDRGDAAKAVRFGEVLIDLDPWNEDGHRLLLEALAISQGRPAALLQFDRLEKMLAEEFGVAPEPETVALVDELSTRPGNYSNAEWAPPGTPHWPSRFFGRHTELDELHTAVGGGRVLAIVGPGGIGKTRLLAALASGLQVEGQRVIYASFDEHDMQSATQTPQVLAHLVLGELEVPIDQSIGAFATLTRTLKSGPAVLCLDNVEVLADVEASLMKLSKSCPELCTVVTTQRHLDLISSVTLELRGLSTDGDVQTRPTALELFRDRARFGVETEATLPSRWLTQTASARSGTRAAQPPSSRLIFLRS